MNGIGMILGCVKNGMTKSLSLTGAALVGLSLVLYVALELSSRWEQAKTPSEKKHGVAVLFMIFGIPCSSLVSLDFSVLSCSLNLNFPSF